MKKGGVMRNLLPVEKKIVEVPKHRKVVSPVASNSILVKPLFDTKKYYFYYTEVQKERDG